jgi:hypothetical protein
MRKPTNPFHSGAVLAEEFLTPARITQTAFAEKIGWTRARLNRSPDLGATRSAASRAARADATATDSSGPVNTPMWR